MEYKQGRYSSYIKPLFAIIDLIIVVASLFFFNTKLFFLNLIFRPGFSVFPLKSLIIVRFTYRKKRRVAKKTWEMEKKETKEGDPALFC